MFLLSCSIVLFFIKCEVVVFASSPPPPLFLLFSPPPCYSTFVISNAPLKPCFRFLIVDLDFPFLQNLSFWAVFGQKSAKNGQKRPKFRQRVYRNIRPLWTPAPDSFNFFYPKPRNSRSISPLFGLYFDTKNENFP